jgi:hypothetical protein
MVTRPSHRLAQRLDRRSLELGELIEEQDSSIRQRGLSRTWRVAATDQTGGGDRVMRRAERPLGYEARGVQASDAVHAGDLDRLRPAHRRQDRGQPPREHRLAGSRRPGEQQVVATGGGDRHRLQWDPMAAHIAQVRPRRAAVARRGDGHCRHRAAGDRVNRGPESAHADHADALDQRRLAGLGFGHDQGRDPMPPCALRDRQRAGRGAE